MNQTPGGSFLSPETLDAIIEIFIEDTPEQLRDIHAALECHDHETLGAISHKLRGSTEFLGASAISSLATDVENAVQARDRERLKIRTPQLIAAVQLLLDQLLAADTETES